MNRARSVLSNNAAIPVAIGLAAFSLYALTAAREPVFGDGLEFVAAAASGGIPHPTGYPSFTILIGIFGSSSYFSAALVCSVIAAVAAGLICFIVRSVWRSQRVEAAIPPFAIAFICIFSASLWRSGTIVEVYGLNAMLSAAVTALLLPESNKPVWKPPMASLCLGLAMTNHLASVALAAPVGWTIVQECRRAKGGDKAWQSLSSPCLCFAALCLGLSPWLYLPIRAAQNPPINWGDPESLRQFLWMVRGGDYGNMRLFMASPGTPFTVGTWLPFAANRVLALTASSGAEFLGGAKTMRSFGGFAVCSLLGLVLLAITAAGARTLWRSHRGFTFSLLCAVWLQLVLVFAYNIADISDYFLGLYVLLLPFATAGFALLPFDEKRPAIRVTIPGAILVAFLANFNTASHRSDVIARSWINRVCEALPENSILMTQGDYDIYAMWYAQLVENQRPDVLVAGANFLRYDWYATMIPERGEDSRGRFVEARQMTVSRDPMQFLQRIEKAVLEENLDRVPVIVTDADPIMLQLLARTYRVEPVATLLTEEELNVAADRLPALPPFTLYRVSATTLSEPANP